MGNRNLIANSEKQYFNLKDLMYRIKSCCYKLFFFIQFHLPSDKKHYDGDVQLVPELPIVEPDLDIAQGDETHSKSYIYAHISP